MNNNNGFIKPFLAFMLALSMLVVAGCDSGSSSKAPGAGPGAGDGITDEATLPSKGTITGYVIDSNRNPVVGQVVVAGKSVEIDASGMFSVDELEATAATSLGEADPSFKVEIQPNDASILGATISVSGNFEDGFSQDVGTVSLPVLNAGLKGVFRDTAAQGPIADLCYQVELVNGPTADAKYSYTSPIAGPTLIDGLKDGEFELTGLPSNSGYKLNVLAAVAGSCVNPDAAPWEALADLLETSAPGTNTDVGNIFLTSKAIVDTTAPYISSVNGISNQAANRGVLNRNIDGTAGIVVNLSESVSAADIDKTTVLVFSETQDRYLVEAEYDVVVTQQSITVSLTDVLTAGEKIYIQLSVNDVKDLAGNSLAESSLIGFDEIVSLNDMDYLQINLQAFKDAAPVAGVTGLKQAFTDSNGDEFGHLSSYAALKDNSQYGGKITQLNGKVRDQDATAERLTELVKVITETGNNIAPDAVEADVARLEFAATDIGEYQIEIEDQAGNKRPVSIVTLIQGGNNFAKVTENNGTLAKVNITEKSSESFFLLKGVEPGWTVKVRQGETGAWATVVLEDAVPPTPVLQRSYGRCINSVYGDGGELAGRQSGVYPRFCVTPLLLSYYAGIAPLAINYETALDPLFNLRENGYNVNTEALEPLGGIDAEYYDAGAYKKWNAKSFKRTVGVAMSEAVSLDAVNGPAYSGTEATLDNYIASNNVIINDQNETVNADLIIFDVDDVLKLAKDHDKEINFADVLKDLSANPADAKAKVVVTDRIPPLVTQVVYDDANLPARKLEVTFNEPVRMKLGAYLEFSMFKVFANTDKKCDINFKDENDANCKTIVNSHDNYTLTFDSSEIAQGLAPNFNGIATETFVAVDGSNRKVVMDFSSVQDKHGNTWADYKDYYKPKFLVPVSDAFARAVKPVSTGFTKASTQFTVEYKMNYPVNTERLFGSANLTALTRQDILGAGFSLSGAAKIEGGSALSVGNTLILTVNLEDIGGGVSGLDSGDSFDAPTFYPLTEAFRWESEPIDPDLDPVSGVDGKPIVQ